MLQLILGWGALALGAVVLLGAGFLGLQFRKFGADAGRVWEVAPPAVRASSDSAVIARGRHIAESYGGCIGGHGDDLGGRLVEEIGPIGVIRAANIIPGEGGLGPEYSDELLARAIRHPIRPDGTRIGDFMPVEAVVAMNETERRALWAFLESSEPVGFGGR